MKTNIFTSQNRSLLLLIPILSILSTSCGSYQNSSYYDRDGIYGNSEIVSSEKAVVDNSSTHYKNYFNSLQDNNNLPTEIFTDVDQYNTTNSNDVNQNSNQTYADWGNNNYGSTSTSLYSNQWVNSIGFGFGTPYFGFGLNNPYYGFGYSSPYFGFGYNNPYYGFGFGNPYYGYGYSNYGYGYGYPYYGYSNYGSVHVGNYNNTYSYNSSRRGSSSNSNTINPNRYSQTPQANTRGGATISNYRSSAPNNTTNTSPLFNRSIRTQNPNNNSNNYSRSNTSTQQNTQQNNNSSRRESSSPSRSYSPSPSNSNNSGSSYGGGSSSGGGGRSSGGGGRTRG
jgi:hypothetical protein